MAISDAKLKNFFSNQKVGTFDALKKKRKISSLPSSTIQNKNIHAQSIENETQSQSQKKTDTKPIPNRYQSGNKTDTKPIPNRYQTDTREDRKSAQFKEETDTKPIPNRYQTDTKPIPTASFSSLVGLQRKAILTMYEECLNSRSKITGQLTLEYLSSRIMTTKNSVKTVCNRLISKGCIFRKEFKNGRGGWSKYELSDQIFSEILNFKNFEENSKPIPNRYQTDTKPIPNRYQTDNTTDTKPIPNPLSSSSSIYTKTTTTTTTEEEKGGAMHEWLEIDCFPLKKIGFGKTQLIQLCKEKCNTASNVQTSIDHFAYGLQHSIKTKSYGHPVNVLMGVLRKGGVWNEPGYRSPEEIVKEEKLKNAKKENEKVLKDRRALEEESRKREEAAFRTALSHWARDLSKEERNKVMHALSEDSHSQKLSDFGKLSMYFKLNIWPSIKSSWVKSSDAC